jgi:hypothetical protein
MNAMTSTPQPWMEKIKNTLFLRTYSFLKIPLIWSLRPSVIDLDLNKTIVEVKLRRFTKNHLGSMYFGALAMGAELVVALRAVHTIYLSKRKVDFVFKDFNIEFHKRAEGNVHFVCEQGQDVKALVDRAIESKNRETQTFSGYALVPEKSIEEKIASFRVTLSVKLKEKN